MITRPVDGNCDMLPVSHSSQMFTGAQAVARTVQERIQLYRGEWWEDDTLGIQIPKFLSDTLKAKDVSLFSKYITNYIAQTEGVRGVANVKVEFNKRLLKYSALIKTDEGNATVEVDLSGLL